MASAATTAVPDTPIGFDQCVADFPQTPEVCADTDGNGYAGSWQPGADWG